ncbi:MAG: SRPBCC domain-containing protein [Ornithinimicrobium sp.]
MAELIQRIEIQATINAVWAEITKLGTVQRPLLNTVLETTFEPGEPIRYRSANGKRTFVVGRIVQVEAPRLLSHTYVMTMYDEPPTLVTWTLEEIAPDLVQVTLKHEGWPQESKTMDKHGKTWVGILADLKQQVETGDVSAKTKVSHALMTTFMFAMPAKTKSENVEVPE